MSRAKAQMHNIHINTGICEDNMVGQRILRSSLKRTSNGKMKHTMGIPKLRLSFACGGYDRMDALRSGEVQPHGIDLNFLTINNSRNLFDRCMRGQEFDASEMSASEYICNYASGERNFVAIPVFPNRAFRHGFITVNSNLISSPRDLEGKKVGVQAYTMTAAVRIRGVLAQAGVDLNTITWVEGALECPGPHGQPASSQSLRSVAIEHNKDPARGLSQLLADGEIAATIGAALPANLDTTNHLRRLFPDHKKVEIEYYQQCGIFPIMHLVVIKRSVVDQYPWIPGSLFDALTQSKDIALRRMKTMGSTRYMLPWLNDEIAETEIILGSDMWPYGLEPNRATLDILVDSLYNQAMIDKRPLLEDLFWPVEAIK